jgi:PAT family beta-lactamase induction signal transducer AmpG
MTTAVPKRTWREARDDYRDRRVIAMLFLGFSAGLPYPLVFATLSRWLSEAAISLTDIGLLSLVGLAYGFKFLWAPLVDHFRLPVLFRHLGRRRSWMLLAQIGIAGGLLGMAITDPKVDLWTMTVFAVVVAFASATQDISIDAWRIEIAPPALQGALAGSYQLGYRTALFVAGAGVFFLVDALQVRGERPDDGALAGWPTAYLVMAGFMAVGLATTLVIREIVPAALATTDPEAGPQPPLANRIAAWLMKAVIDPFVDFFTRNGWMGVVILAFIGCYWLSDRVWGVMAQPFYHQLGFSKTEVAIVAKSYGIFLSVAGALLGAAIVSRFGLMRPLLICVVLTGLTNLLFLALAEYGKSVPLLVFVISAENLASGMAGTALIAYLSSLTNTAYTATQYALFSSLMVLPGKLVAGASGWIVESIGFSLFFVYTTLMGIPALVLLLILMANAHRMPAPTRAV